MAITLSPKELLEKVAALIPIPRFNLFRYAGIFVDATGIQFRTLNAKKGL